MIFEMNAISYSIGSINMNGISSKNKIDALRAFVYLTELDIVLLQEVPEQIDINGFDSFINIDHRKRGTEILVRSHIKTSAVQRSIDSRIISLKIDEHVTICNVYAPSGSAQRVERERFFTDTIQYYINNGVGELIVGGDFNAVIQKKDANHTSNHSQSLKFLVESLNLTDAWEHIHKTVVDYTFVRNGSGARLDRFYVTEGIRNNVVNIKSNVCCFSDHKAVILKVKLPNLGKPHRNRFWRMNDSVLTEDVLTEFRAKWVWWVRQRRYYDSWFTWWNELAKKKIASFVRWKTSIVRKREHDTMEFYYAALNLLHKDYIDNPGLMSEINHVKGKMLALQKQISSKYYAHSKTMIAGEDTSIFQVGEQIKNRGKATIKSLEISGNTERNAERIEREIVSYFQKLYSASEVIEDDFFNPQRAVEEDLPANTELMNPVTEDELLLIIKSSQSKKSPGIDGLSKQFYLKCWSIIKTELVAVVNDVMNGKMSKNFVEGVIILIHKKGSRENLQNYRPITLLNFDYRMVARIFKARLSKISPLLLSKSQKCTNRPRNIFETTCGIRDKILETNLKKKTSILLSFDLEKAFDRVSHAFLEKTMHKMGINNSFIQFLKQVNTNSFSRIMINGSFSTHIKIERSVRQGDPLAMLLFCLYLEPLLQKLKRLCHTELDMLNCYADDISLILNDFGKLDEIRSIFEKFELVSGAKVNLLKTKAMIIGLKNTRRLPAWVQLSENIKILGIYYHNNSLAMMKLNWEKVVQSLRFILWNNQFRNLNLIQKVIYINTFASSKIWFVASTVPIDKKTNAKIKNIYGNFLWHRAPLRVAFDQLCLSKKRGGLGLISPELKCKALLLNRYLQSKLELPFFHTITERLENPPNIKDIPLNSPFLKTLFLELPYIAENVKENPTANAFYNHYITKIARPHIEQKYPNFRWSRIWKNIFNKNISSEDQTSWFLLVNEKIPCGEQQFRFGRTASEMCTYCPQEIEDWKHRYANCIKVRNCWWYSLTQIKLINRTRTRNLSFDNFKFPVLNHLNTLEKTRAAKIFIGFFNYIKGKSRDELDLSELIFYLSCRT